VLAERDLVLGVSPCEEPNARMVAAVCRAGGLGVLDLGRGDRWATQALELAAESVPDGFAVRVPAGCALRPADLERAAPGRVHTVLLAAGSPWSVAELAWRYRVLVEVTGVDEATAAAAAGASGLVARGHEAGGTVGELSSFVLLQRLLADNTADNAAAGAPGLPVWVAGGIGLRTAAASVVGGAAGVVLDSQLALLAESDLPEAVRSGIRGMDGSETVLDGGRRTLRRSPVPVGQDGFLASRFAARYGDTASAVRAVRAAIRQAAGDPTPPDLLAPGAPLAATLRITVPVVQGPMTRVSDEPGFAAAVADAGGLPFIALALSGPEQTRSVLERTRAELGDRPWGVGVLGFAPEETRAAQLAVIQEIRPACAIIAGGRPSQASALEAAGISTFLHVPAPGLLRQFLDAGARKFVFEGAECGGHVGPRASFPLWEAQLAVLDDFLDANPDAVVQVLFAGGIHDARSAAMVAVLAAPLAARGARIGVLMGSAYLFTAEAVDRGAIGPVFQRQVLAADRTDLLESAPGHATRCAASPFSAEFRVRKERLAAEGVPSREAWEQLEQLNVGRLRVASKGRRRDGDTLVEVDEASQLADGLFMAGQVAVLRSAVTTVADLHAAVSTGAAEFHAARIAALRAALPPGTAPEPEPAPLDVAIVGMACVFPGSPDLASFWQTILGAADAITEVPPDRWDPDTYYAPDGNGRKTPSKWGGFLAPVPFDPLRYGIPPAALRSIEPSQLLALEVARRALEDAGYAKGVDHSRTSVVFGAEAGSDLSNTGVLRNLLPAYLGELPPELDEQLPELTEDSFPGVLSNVIAGRIANRLDLGGANYTVDAACASSLAAVDVACKELTAGSSDLVLCGAVDLHNGINDYLLFSSVHALSPTGRSRTFDAKADGIALGEGVACVVLKRLADAERDGDRVYAVIKGVGSASDGRALGLTAPRPEGQRRALERAYRNAGVSPADVGLVEAHGTGTVVGDRTELTTLTALFTESGARPGSCVLGSVKSQIGHTKCAAGLAGLIKATMAVYTGVRPPTVHLDQPNPAWDAECSPFAFHTGPAPWTTPVAERVAGVSAFGFGGTNFHVVLRAHDTSTGQDSWAAELFLFRGTDRTAAHRTIAELLDTLAANDRGGRPWRLRDIARLMSRRADARTEPVQVAVVAGDLDQLATLLRAAVDGGTGAGLFRAGTVPDGKVAYLFPGQGSQRPGMLADLFTTFPELRRYLRLGGETVDLVYPPAAFDPDRRGAQDSRVRDTRVAQPALGLAGLAVEHLLGRLGVEPDLLAGHSYGELVALSAAGAFGAGDLMRLSSARAQAILDAAGGDPGAMAAVSAGSSEVERVLSAAGLAGRVVPANQNAPRQTVVSGPTADVDAAVAALRDAGLGAKRIPVACAFHSPLVSAAGVAFAATLDRVPVEAPRRPVWANRTAAPYGSAGDDVRAELAAQIGAPVRFADQIEAMYAAGARVFVETGPGRVLTRLVGDILGDRPHVAVACEPRPAGGLRGFLEAVAELAVAGVPVRTGWLFAGRDAVDITGAAPPPQPGWTVDGQCVRTRDGRPVPGGLTPARRLQETTLTRPGPQSDPDALLTEYLRTSREMVAAQRDVLLAYFGGTRAAPRPEAPVITLPAAVEPAPVVGTPEPVAAATAPDILATVLDIISERTGYPADMIEVDLDLEADLSVDSIKRTEIAGELANRLGIGGGAGRPADAEIEDLVKARTARTIADWLRSRIEPGATPPAIEEKPIEAPAPPVPPKRLIPRRTATAAPTPADPGAALHGTAIAIAGDASPVAGALAALLTEHGVTVVPLDGDGPVDGVIHCGGLAPADGPLLPGAVTDFQHALRRSPRWLLAGAHDGSGDGLRGLLRTIRREYPTITARAVEVDPAASPADTARALLAELVAADAEPVVGHTGGQRYRIELVETPLGTVGTSGAGPAGDGTAEAQAIGLDRDSVVVLVGGARGITARFAAALASASRCRIELVGRTTLPVEPEPPELAAAGDRAALRAALIARGTGAPAEIERQLARIVAQREVAATLAELARLGSPARYHTVDVRDAAAVGQLFKQIHTEHGRLDGLVYAAGVIEDRLLAEKDPESFRRVFGTKVDGARSVLAALDTLQVRPAFVVCYGSVAAVHGNRGQADYAAANDALESLGRSWAARTGNRCLTVHWGPWAPAGAHGGMVSTELAREYARRGVALIDPEEGTLSLLRELAWGDPAETAVVYTA
jgi:acyl transferase domain-containing protein/NAD(P)H-dependent flavin oxidoreductase YrpB (nitropropane dioxygenase family)/NADP-dependent 3-hydroxy acid dehydrogenase YdfG